MNVFAKNILYFYLTIINYIMEVGTLRIIQCNTKNAMEWESASNK